MFVIDVTYTQPLDTVRLHLDDHVAWLERQVAAGTIVASGRKVPWVGGMMLAVAPERAAVEAVMATEPFTVAGVAEHRITEFRPVKTVPELAAFREPPA